MKEYTVMMFDRRPVKRKLLGDPQGYKVLNVREIPDVKDIGKGSLPERPARNSGEALAAKQASKPEAEKGPREKRWDRMQVRRSTRINADLLRRKKRDSDL